MAEKIDSVLKSETQGKFTAGSDQWTGQEVEDTLVDIIDSKLNKDDYTPSSPTAAYVVPVTVQAYDDTTFKRNDSQSSIVLPNGDILIVFTNFYGATSEDNGTARLYAKNSTDDGLTWGNGRVVITNANTTWNVYCPNLYLRTDGTVGLVFLAKSPSAEITKYYQMTSSDNGATWGTPVQLLDAPTKYTISAFDRIFKARSGRWFMPLQENQNGISDGNSGIYTGFYLYSDNQGVSWVEAPSRTLISSPDGLVDEPGMFSVPRFVDSQANEVEKLVYYWRTRSGTVYAVESINNGATWSAAFSLGIEAPNSTTTIVGYKGSLIACHNRLFASNPSTAEARAVLDLSISKDNGSTWSRTVTVEHGTGQTQCYFQPSMMIEGTTLYCFYGSFTGLTNGNLNRGACKLRIYDVEAICGNSITRKFSQLMVAATVYQMNNDPAKLFGVYLDKLGKDNSGHFFGSASGSDNEFWPAQLTKASVNIPLGLLWTILTGQDAATYGYSAGLTINVKSNGGGSVSTIPLLKIQNNGVDKLILDANGNLSVDGTVTSF
jgi:hypothetical protein